MICLLWRWGSRRRRRKRKRSQAQFSRGGGWAIENYIIPPALLSNRTSISRLTYCWISWAGNSQWESHPRPLLLRGQGRTFNIWQINVIRKSLISMFELQAWEWRRLRCWQPSSCWECEKWTRWKQQYKQHSSNNQQHWWEGGWS